MLCCNLNRSDKRKIGVVGKSKKQRCFKDFRHDLYVNYCSNDNAWAINLIFKDWMMNFNKDMKNQNRQTILLLDNAGSYKTIALSNVELLFLFPNTTSCLIPLDAGIQIL
jgi:hypothetical protein